MANLKQKRDQQKTFKAKQLGEISPGVDDEFFSGKSHSFQIRPTKKTFNYSIPVTHKPVSRGQISHSHLSSISSQEKMNPEVTDLLLK
jgi:hypothetical protein